MIYVAQSQEKPTCAAVALASILGKSEIQALGECNTGKLGTRVEDLREAFHRNGYATHLAHVKSLLGKVWWLAPLSTHFPLVCLTRNHAFVVANETIYDNIDWTAPVEFYSQKKIDSIIVVDKELDTYAKQLL